MSVQNPLHLPIKSLADTLAHWLVQIGIFAAMFALPCLIFVVSTIVAEELRDFFESTALSVSVHLLLSAFLGIALYEVMLVVAEQQMAYFGLIIHIGYALLIGAWTLGANGCLYGDQAPSKRIGARGIKRDR